MHKYFPSTIPFVSQLLRPPLSFSKIFTVWRSFLSPLGSVGALSLPLICFPSNAFFIPTALELSSRLQPRCCSLLLRRTRALGRNAKGGEGTPACVQNAFLCRSEESPFCFFKKLINKTEGHSPAKGRAGSPGSPYLVRFWRKGGLENLSAFLQRPP